MIDPIEHNQPAYFYMNRYEILACPARFERATYALEAVKISKINRLNNGLSLAKKGVRYAPKSMVRSGMPWI